CIRRISFCFFFSSRRRHTRFSRDWSSDVCSSDLVSPRARASGSLRTLSGKHRRQRSFNRRLLSVIVAGPSRRNGGSPGRRRLTRRALSRLPQSFRAAPLQRQLRGCLRVRFVPRSALLLLPVTLAALLLLRFDLLGLRRMLSQEGLAVDIAAFAGTERVGARRFIDGEVGFDFVLEPEFPGVGFGRVVLPEAVVSHTQARIVAAFLVDAVGEVACREVGPVVVLTPSSGA